MIGLALLAVPGSTAAQDLSAAVSRQIEAIVAEKNTRTPTERKLDSQLLYLARERTGTAAVAAVPTLRSRATTGADNRVRVDLSAAPSADLSRAIADGGGIVLYESPRWGSVSARVLPSALLGLAGRADVRAIKRATSPLAHTGAITNEADAAHNADDARAMFNVNGSGIKVCVISDSNDHSDDSVASGELPAFATLPGRSGQPGTGEGTAMSEIVADLAPGAQIVFAAAGPSKAFMADSILLLRADGCQVIVDDISFSDELQFQDDEIGQAVNEVVADGAIYLSSAGNEGNLTKGTSSTWEGNFRDGGTSGLLPSGRIHRFGTATYNQLTAGSDARVSLLWSDEGATSANDYDLFVLDAAGTTIVNSSTSTQDGDDVPLETVDSVNPGERIVVWKADAAAARYVRLIAPCCGARLQVATAGQTIGHANTPNTITVGAADASAVAPGPFTSATKVESSTSDGPRKMFYRPDGTPITPNNFLASGGLTIQTPALTAGDGGATSVPGFEQFYGTSAAAPAAAAIAALVWSRQPTFSGTYVRAILEGSTIDIESAGPDNISGNGILMADLAVANSCLVGAIIELDPLLAAVQASQLGFLDKLTLTIDLILVKLTVLFRVETAGTLAFVDGFVGHVNDLRTQGRLTAGQAQQLLAPAARIRANVVCRL